MRPDTRPSAKRKPSRKSMKARADRMFADYIKARDGECQAEGPHNGRLECAHLVSRRYNSTRHDPQNAVTLCHSHHFKWTNDPVGWHIWVDDRIGSLALMALYRKANSPWSKDLEGTLAALADLLSDFDGSGVATATEGGE